MRKIRRMFWDIETCPNVGVFWQCGYKVNIGPQQILEERRIICICWKWEGESKIHHLTWDENQDDRQMVEEFLEVAKEADEMIAHNGDHFDLPWFQGQCAKYGLGPLPDIKTVDTLAIARRKFNYNSYTLDYLCNLWFGEKKLKTSIDLWLKCMAGNKSALKKMVKYCKHDVELQEMCWGVVAPFYRPKVHAGVLSDLARWTCPHDGSTDVKQDKIRATAAGIRRYQFYCNECGRYYTVPEKVYRDYKEYKNDMSS